MRQVIRQGGLVLIPVDSIPSDAGPVPHESGRLVLSQSEVTGYADVINNGSTHVTTVKHRADSPSAAATIDRAFSLANEAMFTIAMQCRRLSVRRTRRSRIHSALVADLQFLLIVLHRLRIAANVARKARGVSIDADIKKFDEALPHLKIMRDVGEHVDVYAVDSSKRHNKEVSRRAVQMGTWDGVTFSWLGRDLNIDTARAAAEALFFAVSKTRQAFIVGKLDLQAPTEL